MRVFPKNEVDFDENNEHYNKNTFAKARQKKYNRKVEENNDLDARVKAAELARVAHPMSDDFTDNADFGDSLHLSDLDNFTNADKVAMLRRYYSPVKYRGTIFPTNGEPPYTLDSIKCRREKNLKVVESSKGTIYDRIDDGYDTLPNGKKVKRRKSRPFNLNDALLKHVSSRDNLGIFFYQDKCKMIAFDIDSETGEVDQSTDGSIGRLILVVHFLGLIPFVYQSGGKGYHLEIFFNERISINKLNTLNQIILNNHLEEGGRHIDCIYPSGKAYRVFGCCHYKTGCFTNAVKYDVEISVNPDTNKNRGHFEGTIINPIESWELFSKTTFNDSTLVDKIIADHPNLVKRSTNSKKGKANYDYAPKAHFYDIDVLKRIHEAGLFTPYTRYNTAFQLGRYFKHQLKLTEDEAKNEVGVWLKRHYVEQCPKEFIPFEGAYIGIIRSPYALCEHETRNNCLNGYHVGKPFKRERVEVFHYYAVEYLRTLKYPRKKEAALLTLLSYAQQFNSLTMGFSYEQFLKLFHVNSKSTVSAWLKEFMTDYIFVCTKKGSYKSHKTSQYRLMLPDHCYKVIEYQEIVAK